MELIQIQTLIEEKINAIEEARKELRPLAEQKAKTIAEYDRDLAVELLKIRTAEDLPANIAEKKARGNCWLARLEMEKADAFYKACVTNLQAIEAELNGYQSMNRYMSER